jgi:hypothetical protein
MDVIIILHHAELVLFLDYSFMAEHTDLRQIMGVGEYRQFSMLSGARTERNRIIFYAEAVPHKSIIFFLILHYQYMSQNVDVRAEV